MRKGFIIAAVLLWAWPAFAIVSQRGTASTCRATGTGSATCSVSTAGFTGCTTGDLLIACLTGVATASNRNTASFTATGFTNIDDTGSSRYRYGSYSQKLAGSLAGTYSFAATNSNGGGVENISVGLACWTGAGLVDTHSKATGTATPAVASGITLTYPGSQVITCFGNGAGVSTFSNPGSQTSLWTYTAFQPSTYGYGLANQGTGATGNFSSTMGTTGAWGALLVGIQPQAIALSASIKEANPRLQPSNVVVAVSATSFLVAAQVPSLQSAANIAQPQINLPLSFSLAQPAAPSVGFGQEGVGSGGAGGVW